MISTAFADLRRRPGVLASIVVLAASIVGHAGNYAYYVVAARMLGPAEFASISAVIAFATLAFMPFSGYQTAAARDVAALVEADDSERLHGYLQALFRHLAAIVLPLGAMLLLAAPLLTRWLTLDSPLMAVTAALWILGGVVLVVAIGALQGLGRFGNVALQLAGPLGALRVLLLPPLVLLAGVLGGVLAMVLATLVGLSLAAPPLWKAARGASGPATLRVGASVLGLLAFASLTNMDILAAKALLPATEAGTYASAALLGKIALFAPAALTLVLLPKAAARLERGERADRPVLLTLAVSGLSGLAIAAFFALLPRALVQFTFGSEFSDAQALVVPLALVMTAAAVLNVHLAFAVARRSRAFMALLVGAAALQCVLLFTTVSDAADIVRASAFAIGGALVVHEVLSPSGALRMLVGTGVGQRSRIR